MNRIAKKIVLMTAMTIQFASVAFNTAQAFDGQTRGTVQNPNQKLEESLKQGTPLNIDPAQALDPRDVINGADQCFYQYQWVCNPFGCAYRYVYVCFPTPF